MTRLPIAVAIMRDELGRVLLVRKRGTVAFMQPGGKIEAGEDAGNALSRELAEELALDIKPEALRYLGQASARAANEPNVTVVAEIFDIQMDRVPIAQAEIEELDWVNPTTPDGLILAPLTRDHILPLALASA